MVRGLNVTLLYPTLSLYKIASNTFIEESMSIYSTLSLVSLITTPTVIRLRCPILPCVPLVVFFFALRNNITDEHQCGTCFSLIANNNLPTRVSKYSRFDHGLCGLRGRFKLTSKFANSVGVSSTINRPRSGTFPA